MNTNSTEHKNFTRRSAALRANLKRRKLFQQQRTPVTLDAAPSTPIAPPAPDVGS